MIDLSEHVQKRMAQRSLSIDDLAYVIAHGQRFHQAGALIYYLRRCDVPWYDQADDDCTGLVGTAVIVSRDGGQVITAWRNQRCGLRRIRRKPKYGLTREQLKGWN